MYKCGSAYQDHPCDDQDAQKRFARGRFDADRAHPDTDRDCARAVAELLPLWKRLHAGEPASKLRGQILARPLGGKAGGDTRDLFFALRESDISGPQARSQLETQCMAFKANKLVTTDAAAPGGVNAR